MGDRPTIWVPDIADAPGETGARLAPRSPRGVVDAVARVLHAAGEDRAVADLRRMKLVELGRRVMTFLPDPALVPSWVERRLATSDEHAAQLMPGRIPAVVAGRRLRGPWPGDRLGVDAVVRGPVAR